MPPTPALLGCFWRLNIEGLGAHYYLTTQRARKGGGTAPSLDRTDYMAVQLLFCRGESYDRQGNGNQIMTRE